MPSRNRRVLWNASKEWKEESNMARYMRWLKDEKRLSFRKYSDLWNWSVTSLEQFWRTIWDYFGVISVTPCKTILSSRKMMPPARWFEGSRLNYAEHVFRAPEGEGPAVIYKQEDGEEGALSRSELEQKVGALAVWLESAGVRRGDRVAAYLPNLPEAVIGFLASASIGAVWSSCAPDFGGPSAIDRFSQIRPKVLIAAEAYSYNGTRFYKTREIEKIVSAIPSIRRVLLVPSKGTSRRRRKISKDTYWWEEATEERQSSLRFEHVPFDHPLWVVYSSGTTGAPKAIVHGHGGILLEHYKVLSLHNDLGGHDRFFWYTTTAWMMWNYLVSGLLVGATIVLYDGSPSYPSMNALWNLCESAGMTFFGTSAAYVSACMKSRVQPRQQLALKRLRGIGSTGSPLSPEAFLWVYRNVKSDLWLASISGGTDLCTAFVGGCVLLPVREGEIQCRCLGAKVEAFDESGKSVVNETGELVITEPMPCMPIYFWNDKANRRYRESYFNVYPGIWRHGDWISVNKDGSCVIYGRSDATIKRMGVRIGSSEIYKAVESVPEVVDSLVVSLEYLGGKSFMPLFVVLKEGRLLDDGVKSSIKKRVRDDLSPRFVPDEILQVSEIPKTLNGKKPEVPIRKILLGVPAHKALNPGSLKNPAALGVYEEYAAKLGRRWRDE